MTHIMMDAFQLTVVAMTFVFVVLAGLMLLMEVTSKLVKGFLVADDQGETALAADEHLARIALLSALAKSAEDEADKYFEVEKIERLK